MTEVSNFSQAWEAYVSQHGNPPKDANQLHKYSKANKEIEEITYPLARLQFDFNKKVVQSAENDNCGDSNDIDAELERLQKQMGGNYGELWERDFFEHGKTDYSKSAIKVMQWNVTLDKNIGKQQQKKKEEKSDEKELSADNWQYRGYRIIETIKNNEPDIITIQELNHFKFMLHYLEPLGYEGILKLNTKSKLLEGVAIFYLKEYFDHQTTYFYGKDVEPKLKFDLSALSIVLSHKKTDKSLVICSANLDAKDKKTNRMNKLMHLTNSLKQISGENDDGIIFIGCDLGTDQSSSEYSSIQSGRWFLKEGKDLPKDYEAGYGLNLESAYYPAFYAGKAKKSEPGSTMFKGNCRDYIFYDKEKNVNCSNVLEVPLDKVTNQHKAYPNYVSPSVHYPLMAQFFF
mmetsp:Transcript_40093/g.35390  ORF Transcript_40093/g.35390 Transcript_40093/m.35390 type:complete len:402 (-) Transcript_40093:37-1242(-)